ncbi:MAG TPA: T9SS type A sorting domain-containing protein [Flavobacterium sp.]
MKKAIITLLILTSITTRPQNSGDLDLNFGVNGKVTTNFGQSNFKIEKQAIQSDGKIVLAGEKVSSLINSSAAIIRLNEDGTIDTSFNFNGVVFNINIDKIYALEIDSNGKILVGGDNALARYNQDGSLDLTFSEDGMIDLTTFELTAFVNFDLQSDGKIVTLWEDDGYSYGVSRFNTDGTLDMSFGNFGIVHNTIVINNLGATLLATAVKVLSDDRLIVGGSRNNDSFICRHLHNGDLDTTFGTDGHRIVGFQGSTSSFISAIASDENDNIIFSNRVHYGSETAASINIIKLKQNGSTDNLFASNGVAATYFSPTDYSIESQYTKCGQLKVQADGKIVLMDYVMQSSNYNYDIFVRKYNSNGSPDITFDEDGLLIYSYYSLNDYGADFSIIGDKILVCGNTEIAVNDNKIALSKIMSDGSFDPTFNFNGKVLFTLPYGSFDAIRASALQPDGKIIAAGTADFNNKSFPIIARYHSNGALDDTFGIGGYVLMDVLPMQEVHNVGIDGSGRIIGHTIYPSNVFRLNSNGVLDFTFGINGIKNLSSHMTIFNQYVLDDNKILIAGHNSTDGGNGGNNLDYALARLNEDGSLDASFGVNGVSNAGAMGTSTLNEQLNNVSILPDGKIIAYGITNDDVKLLRYNIDGSLDTSFNQNGMAVFGDSYSNIPYHMEVSNGYIYILYDSYFENHPFTISRVTLDGHLDTAFGENGLVVTDLPYYTNFQKMKVQTDGKVLLAGRFTVDNYDLSVFTLVRYNGEGSIDSSFGNQGVVITDFNNGEALGYSLLITSEDKALVFGTAYSSYDSDNDFAIAQYYLSPNLSSADHTEEAAAFYPNPVSRSLYLQNEVKLFELYSLDGRKIFSVEGHVIDLSSLPSGMYITKSTFDSNVVVTKKLIKN